MDPQKGKLFAEGSTATNLLPIYNPSFCQFIAIGVYSNLAIVAPIANRGLQQKKVLGDGPGKKSPRRCVADRLRQLELSLRNLNGGKSLGRSQTELYGPVALSGSVAPIIFIFPTFFWGGHAPRKIRSKPQKRIGSNPLFFQGR